MSVFKVTGIKESDGEIFKAIPAGAYNLVITGIKEDISGEKSKYPGSPTIRVMCKVAPGEDHAGASLSKTLVMPTEKMDDDYRERCVATIKRLLMACKISDVDEDFDPSNLVGNQFLAQVSVRVYEGKNTNDISDFCIQ